MTIARIGKADVFHFRTAFDDGGRALNLQVFDHNHSVTILEDVAVGVLNCGRRGFLRFDSFRSEGAPFVAAFRADPQIAVLVNVLGIAFRALKLFAHGLLNHGGDLFGH